MAVAISAIGAAAAAVGTEAFVGLAATAIADTGLALTVVGAVTGSKDLMKAGSILGMAGGIAGIANNPFGAAGAAGVDGAAASGASDVTAGTLADEGLAAQGNSVNALDQGANYDGLAKLDSSPDLSSVSGAPSSSQPLDSTAITTQTGKTIGGNPTLTGAGGNVDPATGMAGSGPGLPSTPPAAAPVASDAVQGNSVNALDQGVNYDGGIINGTRASSIIDGIKDVWGGLSKDAQATILRAALSVPGGIQAQKNKARELALQEARVKQTSYGSAVPSFSLPSTPGIVNAAKG
jgi:hypothetical protein